MTSATMTIGEGTYTDFALTSEADVKANAFFIRAELVDLLESIWNTFKRLPIGTVFNLVKIAVIMAVVVALANSISLAGLMGLFGAVMGLLVAAIATPIVLGFYAALLAIKRYRKMFFGNFSVAVILTWLFGFTPVLALVLSPLLLFGCMKLESSEIAKKNVEDFLNTFAKAHRATLSAVEKALQGVDFSAVEKIAKRSGLHTIEHKLNQVDFKSIGGALRKINLSKFEKALQQIDFSAIGKVVNQAAAGAEKPSQQPAAPQAKPGLSSAFPSLNFSPKLPSAPGLPWFQNPRLDFSAKLPTLPKLNISPTLRIKPKLPRMRKKAH